MKIGSYILALITYVLLHSSGIAIACVPAVPDTDKGFDDPIPQGEFDELFIPLKRVQNLFLVEARVD
ncbi:MAG: hypothetical protein KAX72_04200, partial [Chitinophagales bacterium]|nr:hypothetical protein [Chitinophagales bacterium]